MPSGEPLQPEHDPLTTLALHVRRQGRMFCPPGREPTAEYKALYQRRWYGWVPREPQAVRYARPTQHKGELQPLLQRPSKPGRMHFQRWLHNRSRKRLDKAVRRNMIRALVETRGGIAHSVRYSHNMQIPEPWRDLPYDRALGEARELAHELRKCGTLSSCSLADVAFESKAEVL